MLFKKCILSYCTFLSVIVSHCPCFQVIFLSCLNCIVIKVEDKFALSLVLSMADVIL